jgi:hypothetical protein
MTQNTVEIPACDLETILRGAESTVNELGSQIAKADDESRQKALLEELKTSYEITIQATKRKAEDQDAGLRL